MAMSVFLVVVQLCSVISNAALLAPQGAAIDNALCSAVTASQCGCVCHSAAATPRRCSAPAHHRTPHMTAMTPEAAWRTAVERDGDEVERSAPRRALGEAVGAEHDALAQHVRALDLRARRVRLGAALLVDEEDGRAHRVGI